MFIMRLLLAFPIAIILIFEMPDKKYPGVNDSLNSKQEPEDQKPLFSFGVITDVQYADCSSFENRYYRSSIDKLEEAVSVFRKDAVDFIVNLGDLIEQDYESYKPVLSTLSSSGIKTYHITGNHDYSVDPRYLSRLPVFTESREGYYSIIYKKYRLVFINGNEISTYSSDSKTMIRQADECINKMKKDGKINAIEWNGGIGSTQLEWINNQLDEADDNTEKVILFCHFPVAPENIHNLLNYDEILEMLFKHTSIIAWFSGHNHAGNYGCLNQIHFVTFKGMVETRKDNSFAIIETYNNRISIRGYGRENSLELVF